MKISKYVSYILILIISSNLNAKSMVWEVKSSSAVIYLGGTLHNRSKKHDEVPCEFDAAYNNTSRLAVQFDLDINKYLESWGKHLPLLRYKNKLSLRSLLSAETKELFRAYLRKRSMPFDRFTKYKPALIEDVLYLRQLSDMGFNYIGIQTNYYLKAQAENKTIYYLEELDQLFSMAISLAKGNEDAYIYNLIDWLNQFEANYPKLVLSWEEGDISSFNDIFRLHDFTKKFPVEAAVTIFDRNDRWLPSLIKALKNEESTLFLLGMQHLVGEHGLLSKLTKLGYSTKQLDNCS